MTANQNLDSKIFNSILSSRKWSLGALEKAADFCLRSEERSANCRLLDIVNHFPDKATPFTSIAKILLKGLDFWSEENLTQIISKSAKPTARELTEFFRLSEAKAKNHANCGLVRDLLEIMRLDATEIGTFISSILNRDTNLDFAATLVEKYKDQFSFETKQALLRRLLPATTQWGEIHSQKRTSLFKKWVTQWPDIGQNAREVKKRLSKRMEWIKNQHNNKEKETPLRSDWIPNLIKLHNKFQEILDEAYISAEVAKAKE